MYKSIFRFLILILFPLGVGGLSALLTYPNMQLYQELAKPPLSPPAVVFPIAWTILYLMMGIASFLIMTNNGSLWEILRANVCYFIQLAMNFFWSLIFFNCRFYAFALVWLLLMYVFIFLCTKYFFKIDRRAGWLMVPYNLWMIFAAYLNLAVVIINGAAI